MLNFTSVRYINFMSVGNYWFEVPLNSNKTTLYSGFNGSGKSQFLSALCFGLFNKPFRDVNKPALVNSVNKKNCVVEVEFTTNNKQYKVVRGIKPNVFEIYENNILINQDASAKDYQEYLERFILKMTFKSFTQIVILGSTSYTPFMQLTPADRRTIIEDLLDIQIFSTMSTVIKERFTVNKNNIISKKHDIELLKQKYVLQKKHIEDLKRNNEEEVSKLETEITTNLQNILNLRESNKVLSEKVRNLQQTVANKLYIENKLRDITKIESQIETNLNKLKRDIQFFQNNNDCPTCRQKINSDFKETEIEKINTKIEEHQSGLEKLERKLLTEQNKLNKIADIQQSIQQLNLKIATNNTSIDEVNKFITRTQKQIAFLLSSKAISEDEQNDLKELKKQLQASDIELEELLTEKQYLETGTLLLKDTGIKTRIIRQYLPIINNLINKYLTHFDFFVNFNLDENFKETIKSRHRDEFTFGSFSEGEKARISIAILFCWREIAKLRNSCHTNLLILDEVIDGVLDHAGIDSFFELLNHIGEHTNVFVLSPKGDVYADRFEKVIRLTKEKGFSRIVDDE